MGAIRFALVPRFALSMRGAFADGGGKEQRVFSACCANLLSELRALTEELESSHAPKVAGLHGAGTEAPACRGWGACLVGASVRRADQTRSSLCMWEQRL